ncbi:hypothetical protein D3C80_1428420 [compost metagenome]
MQQLHVAGVRRVAVEHLRSPGHATHDLRQRGIFQVAQTGARLVLAQRRKKQIPQPLAARQGLEVGHERHRKLPGGDALLPGADARHNVGVQEITQLLTQCFGAGAVGKVHGKSHLDHGVEALR